MSVALMDAAQAYGEPVETYFGLYAGIVVDNTDPDEKGRVLVRLPWIDPDFETLWAPVSQIYAGSGYGAYWIPEIDDQVLVAFMRGELRKPVVIGSIYSRDRTPYAARSGGADPKLFRTVGGHMLLMEDGSGAKIQLIDKTGNNEITIDSESNTITIKANSEVVVESSNSVTVSATGNLSITAGGSISIEASGSLSIKGATISLN
jgi:uncharacterized protein involved in type VI secretion and phage assembly